MQVRVPFFPTLEVDFNADRQGARARLQATISLQPAHKVL
jgi:hypothetical protein